MTIHTPRTPSAVDNVAEEYARQVYKNSPSMRIMSGVDGDPYELDDYSPAAAARHDELNARTLAELDKAEATSANLDSVDAVTLDAMRERLGLERELHERGLDSGDLNIIASPIQDLRDLFDLVPTQTAEDWDHNAGKLANVPTALAGYRDALQARVASGKAPAIRQVKRVIEQAQELAQSDGHYSKFIDKARGTVDDALHTRLTEAAAAAQDAMAQIAQFLKLEIAPLAVQNDACGREDYELFSRQFLGAQVDLDETYEWGLDQLAHIDAEQKKVIEKLYPGATLAQAFEALSNDPKYTIHGLDALKAWMQEKADDAITMLVGTHFDIAEPLKTIECMVLEDGTGGIYYTGPTDDFSRPGRMWWSVPRGVETFAAWQELTTVYHEGVPGHHLQVAQATYLRDTLNTWRRNLCWVSGHGEGWALYAERFMYEQGFLEEPAYYFGMLDSQRLRAARVCLDIGVHLGKEAPESIGGGTWDAEKAWTFLTDNAAMDRNFLAFELDRYLGWPGQAPSYKVGQRLWEQARDAAGGSLKDFHTRALNLGSVGLDTLMRAL